MSTVRRNIILWCLLDNIIYALYTCLCLLFIVGNLVFILLDMQNSSLNFLLPEQLLSTCHKMVLLCIHAISML